MRTAELRDPFARLGEPLFFFAYVVFMTATVLQTTMYTEMRYVPQLFIAMRYFAFAVAAVKVLLDLTADLRAVDHRRDRLLDWVAVLVKYMLMSALVVVVSVTADERSLVFLLVLLLAARGVDVEKIFRVTLWLQIILAVFIFLSAMTGIIIDLRFERGGAFTRHGLGYWFPSYVMSYYFFILLLLFWTRKTPFRWTTVALLEGLNLLLFLLTDARLGLIMNTGLLVAELVRSIDKARRPVSRFVRKVLDMRVLGPVVRWGWTLLPEVLCGFLAVLFAFPTSLLAKETDALLSNRIYYAFMGVQNHGLHLFGNAIEWIGFGARADMSEVEATYNFVDCSYVFILLNFGVILFLCMLLCFLWVSVRLARKGDLHRTFLWGTIFLYCFIEPRLLELNMNTFLFLTAPLLAQVPYLRQRKRVQKPASQEPAEGSALEET